jgi:hypothetical protein
MVEIRKALDGKSEKQKIANVDSLRLDAKFWKQGYKFYSPVFCIT